MTLVDWLSLCFSSAENFSVELALSARLATTSCCGFRPGAFAASMSGLTGQEYCISHISSSRGMLTERELAVLHGKLTAADTPLDGVAVVLTAQAKESVMLKLI